MTDLVRASIDERVAPLDDRYRAASIDDGGQALGAFFCIQGKGWRWFRRHAAERGELGTFASTVSGSADVRSAALQSVGGPAPARTLAPFAIAR